MCVEYLMTSICHINLFIADMPGTFIRYFYLGGALRWLMDTLIWPQYPEYRNMIHAFRDAFNRRGKGTHAMTILSSFTDSAEESSHRRTTHTADLPVHIYVKLLALVNNTWTTTFASIHEGAIGSDRYLSDEAEYTRSIDHEGVTYATPARRGERNSFILIARTTEGRRQVVAAQISDIFYHARRNSDSDEHITEPFIVAKTFKTLSEDDASHDPYLKFPDVATWLCYNELESEEYIIRPQDIVSHFAALIYTPPGIGRECIVVRSLDRVSLPLVLLLHLVADIPLLELKDSDASYQCTCINFTIQLCSFSC